MAGLLVMLARHGKLHPTAPQGVALPVKHQEDAFQCQQCRWEFYILRESAPTAWASGPRVDASERWSL